mmetsp:Transcript_20442/g.61555  ORF Transcript_20442/g.61555 Transcript_20442/m.61555 type:complete len:102 (-) Transcript_20442:225-530(-)
MEMAWQSLRNQFWSPALDRPQVRVVLPSEMLVRQSRTQECLSPASPEVKMVINPAGLVRQSVPPIQTLLYQWDCLKGLAASQFQQLAIEQPSHMHQIRVES